MTADLGIRKDSLQGTAELLPGWKCLVCTENGREGLDLRIASVQIVATSDDCCLVLLAGILVI